MLPKDDTHVETTPAGEQQQRRPDDHDDLKTKRSERDLESEMLITLPLVLRSSQHRNANMSCINEKVDQTTSPAGWGGWAADEAETRIKRQ